MHFQKWTLGCTPMEVVEHLSGASERAHHRRCWWILANFHDAVTELSQVNNQKPKRVFQWTKASNSWDSLALDTTIPVVSMFVPRPVICHGGASNLWGGMEKIIRPCLAFQKIIERFEDIPTHPTNNRYNTNDNIQFESRAMRHGLRSRQYYFNRIHQNKRVCYSVASSDVTIGWSKYGDLCLQSNMPNVTGDVEGSQRPMQIGVSTWDESQRWDAYEFYRGCNQTLRSKMIQNQIHKSAMNSAENLSRRVGKRDPSRKYAHFMPLMSELLHMRICIHIHIYI